MKFINCIAFRVLRIKIHLAFNTVIQQVSLFSSFKQEVSQATISYWHREQLRENLRTLKKSVDDIERAMLAQVAEGVVEDAKQLIGQCQGQTIVVHQFNALTNGKVPGVNCLLLCIICTI
jgi:alanyl-tRNA synthetase